MKPLTFVLPQIRMGCLVLLSVDRATLPFLAVIVAASLFFGCNSAAAIELPDDVRFALTANVEHLSPCRVAWTEQRESRMTLKQLADRVQNTNGALLQPSTRLHVISGPRFYHHAQYSVETDGRIDVQQQHTSFDGTKIIHASDHKDKQNWYMIETPARFIEINKPGAWVFYTEYFNAVGIRLGNRAGELFDPPKSLPLALMESGGELIEFGKDRIESEECLVLTIDVDGAVNKFWLSPRMGYSVVRSQRSDGDGKLLVRIMNSDFKMLSSPSLWLPRQAVVEYYQWHSAPDVIESTPLITLRCSVTEMSRTSMDDSTFRIDTTKGGSVIMDGTIEGEKDDRGQVCYVVPTSEKDLVERLGPRSTSRQWLIAVNVGALVVGIGYLIARSKSST